MLKTIFLVLLPFLAFFGNSTDNTLTGVNKAGRDGNTGIQEKLIVASGSVTMDVNLNRLKGAKGSATTAMRFDVEHDAFFTVLVFDGELRGPLPSSMALIPQNTPALPAKLSASYNQLVVESMPWGGEYQLVVRDGKTGFIYFNIEGHQFDYDSASKTFSVQTGRVLLSKEFAAELGRPSDSGAVVGQINITASMRPIEVTQVVDGEVKSADMPSLSPEAGGVPGPDVIVGDLSGLAQFNGSTGTQVGLAVGTDSCNFGTENLHWFRLPDNDHPVIPQNLYRMSGGATNDDRFEQIGQSNVKHAFTALTNNICSLGCNGVGGTNLGSGCSDPYDAGLNAGPSLGSRSWINPFTGAYPRGDSGATNPNNHSGHTHSNTAHKILVEIADLSTTLNPGATYYAESQYITPHEYVWCQSHAGQCNMNNNVSYRKYSVNGTGSPFSFTQGGSTQRTKAAITAWTGATLVGFEPDPGNDGIGTVGYKVTQTSPGVWHYEYAVYNQNMDRGIQSFSVPMGSGVTVSNVGFHAPPQQPGWTFDGTLNNTGLSGAAWAQSQAGGAMTWNSETLAQNVNANAIRWGTMYNFRFDSNRPPQTMNATIGFYKTGAPIVVQIQGPSPVVATGPFTVSGRLTNGNGQGVGGVVVILDGPGGARFTLSSPFGFYSFDQVIGGGTYSIGISSKRFAADPQTMAVNDNLNVDFVLTPSGRPGK